MLPDRSSSFLEGKRSWIAFADNQATSWSEAITDNPATSMATRQLFACGCFILWPLPPPIRSLVSRNSPAGVRGRKPA